MHSPEGLMLKDRLERGPTGVMRGVWDRTINLEPHLKPESMLKFEESKENWRKIFKFCFVLSKLFKCCWECGQDSNRMYHWLEREKVLVYGKMLRCAPPKIKWCIIWSSKSIFGYTQGKERCGVVLKQVFISCISISRLFTISQIYKKFINRLIKNMVYMHERLLCSLTVGNLITFYNMGETWGLYAKWSWTETKQKFWCCEKSLPQKQIKVCWQ